MRIRLSSLKSNDLGVQLIFQLVLFVLCGMNMKTLHWGISTMSVLQTRHICNIVFVVRARVLEERPVG